MSNKNMMLDSGALGKAARALWNREMNRGMLANEVLSGAAGKLIEGLTVEPFDKHRLTWLADAEAAIHAYLEALSAARPEAQEGWRPIETAPFGEVVLAFAPDYSELPMLAIRSDKAGLWREAYTMKAFAKEFPIKFWRSLPPPPQSDAKGEE